MHIFLCNKIRGKINDQEFKMNQTKYPTEKEIIQR